MFKSYSILCFNSFYIPNKTSRKRVKKLDMSWKSGRYQLLNLNFSVQFCIHLLPIAFVENNLLNNKLISLNPN